MVVNKLRIAVATYLLQLWLWTSKEYIRLHWINIAIYVWLELILSRTRDVFNVDHSWPLNSISYAELLDGLCVSFRSYFLRHWRVVAVDSSNGEGSMVTLLCVRLSCLATSSYFGVLLLRASSNAFWLFSNGFASFIFALFPSAVPG